MALPAFAGGSINSGNYVLHYSAVNSLQIPQAVADSNGIDRAGDTAIVMITLQKPTSDAPLNAVPADVTGSARSLMGERKTLSFKRVENAGSVYSLAPVAIEDEQTLTFDLNVRAADGRATIPVQFNQTFYTG
ncbi:hypothetical protein T35B1_14214 [Salinisphaera shabanensis T35B1]|uniref:DUF4426 domain-containing protein n=1 Tax=Salinisphaera shabanensis TaxID=180542 RepID=UPI00333E9723